MISALASAAHAAAAFELAKKLARCGLADARRRQLVDCERPEVGERHLAPHQQRNHLLGVADALEPAHPRPQRVERRVPVERIAAVCRVARGGTRCLGFVAQDTIPPPWARQVSRRGRRWHWASGLVSRAVVAHRKRSAQLTARPIGHAASTRHAREVCGPRGVRRGRYDWTAPLGIRAAEWSSGRAVGSACCSRRRRRWAAPVVSSRPLVLGGVMW